MAIERPRRPRGPLGAAGPVFKPAAPKPVAAIEPAKPRVPGARQLVSLRLDEDVVEHFQADGPGWQDRVNAALRKAMEG